VNVQRSETLLADTEWTVGVGLRRAGVHLIMWSIVCTIGWAAALWLLAPLINSIPDATARSTRTGTLLYALIAVPAGGALAHVQHARMLDAAGFTSRLLSACSLMFIWATAIGGVLLVNLVRPLRDDRDAVMYISVGAIATVIVIYETLVDR